MNYSLSKGLSKALIGVLTILVALLFTLKPEVANMSLATFVAETITKYAGTMTVAGLFTLIINFVKVTTAK